MNKEKVEQLLAFLKKSIALLEKELLSEGSNTDQGNTAFRVQQADNQDQKSEVNAIWERQDWPSIVPQKVVQPPDKNSKLMRADAILDSMLDRSVKGLNILDFGCGEGYVAQRANERGAAKTMGYDIIDTHEFEESDRLQFTSDSDALKQTRWDVIIVFDVLDHTENVIDVMNLLRSVCSESTIVVVRNHPWTSPHAAHLLNKGCNKSHVHLVFSFAELEEKELFVEFVRQEKDPLTSYEHWIRTSGFNVVREKTIEKPVNKFFHEPEIKQRIQSVNQLKASELDQFYHAMRLCFVDYVLSPKS